MPAPGLPTVTYHTSHSTDAPAHAKRELDPLELTTILSLVYGDQLADPRAAPRLPGMPPQEDFMVPRVMMLVRCIFDAAPCDVHPKDVDRAVRIMREECDARWHSFDGQKEAMVSAALRIQTDVWVPREANMVPSGPSPAARAVRGLFGGGYSEQGGNGNGVKHDG